MATSAKPAAAVQPPMTQLVLHVSLKMAQFTSMAVPPLYAVSSLILRRGKQPFSISRLMRISTGSVGAGAGIGAVMGWGRLRNEPEEALIDRVERMVRHFGIWYSGTTETME